VTDPVYGPVNRAVAANGEPCATEYLSGGKSSATDVISEVVVVFTEKRVARLSCPYPAPLPAATFQYRV
jgi:hypothetical protein